MHTPMSSAARLMALLSILLISACAGSSGHMRDVAPAQASYSTQDDKSLIVFMRPSGLGFAIQSSVFDVSEGDPKFVGIVSAKAKIAHYAEPGERRFMVVSESADFMGATLEPGKAYYVLVTPRFGVWKARFSLRPVQSAELAGTEFAGWYRDSRWVENTESALTWASSNMPSVRQKMAENLPKWLAKSDKPVLMAEDGWDSPYQPPS